MLKISLQGFQVQKNVNILKGALKSEVMRQFITMNQPQGGETFRALFRMNYPQFTDSWKLQSSRMMFPEELLSAIVKSQFRTSFKLGFPVRQLFICIEPSIELLIIYPLELNSMFIFSKTSTNISFCLFLLTETLEALDEIVFGLKSPKDPNFLISINELLVSTTSEAINGLMWEVLVSWGCPKSIIQSKIQQTNTKFFLIIYSVIVPRKSLITTITRFNSSSMKDGDTLNLVVATIQIEDFFKYAKFIPQMLKIGQTSPFDSLTFLQKSYGVFFIRSERKSLLIIESPLDERKNIWEIIFLWFNRFIYV